MTATDNIRDEANRNNPDYRAIAGMIADQIDALAERIDKCEWEDQTPAPDRIPAPPAVRARNDQQKKSKTRS